MKDGHVNYDEFCRMADAFISSGLNYFDTAHGYIGGQSETAIRDCVAKRHDRSEFLLTDKLTEPYFRREEDIRPFFESQLKACGVEYFDFYLMHAQDRNNYPKFKRCRAYETALQLKVEGKIRHFGILYDNYGSGNHTFLSFLSASDYDTFRCCGLLILPVVRLLDGVCSRYTI